MANDIDLKPFCGTSEYRQGIKQPFNRDGYTWATNGHILIRVPLRDDAVTLASDDTWVPDAPGIFNKSFTPGTTPHKPIAIKPQATEGCSSCHGSRFEHDCPDCSCECEDCDGTGTTECRASIEIWGGIFNAEYVRLLQTLPGLRLATAKEGEPLPFSFDGGDGLIMPLRGPYADHTVAKAESPNA